ncbi:MAG TPA: prolyl oligopeptidase family serine peptidase [Telluria sp.]|nr:prolyl oligopeptidase family serine peptidase [Telluria sp.]
MRLSALPFLAAAAFALPAAAATPISLDQAMANPDWIGTPAEAAWWSWDGKHVFYQQKRAGSPLRDTFEAVAGRPRLVGDAELANLDGAAVVYNRERTRAILLRNGDLFERDLKSGALTQITRGSNGVAAPQYSADGRSVQFRVGHEWLSWSRADHLIAPVALVRAAKDPAAAPDDDAMRSMQMRLIMTLKRQKNEREAGRERAEQERRADATRAPSPIYLGDKVVIDGSALSPDGRWLLVVTAPKTTDHGRIGKLPRYVTESGYEEFDDQRTRVGRNMPAPHTLKLIDLATHAIRELPFDALPGIGADPLAAMRAAQKLAALKGNRAVRIDDDGADIQWSANGAQAAVMVRAIDNKDRWIATVDLAGAKLRPVQRVTDSAWVNNGNNDFGWLPDNSTLWYLSEESGYSHLYTLPAGGTARALTQGKWEATDINWSSDGATAYMLCNRETPGEYEVCAVSARDGATREVTALGGGVEKFALSPDQGKLLVHYSSSYMPTQLASVPLHGGAAVTLTDTRTPGYKARQWIEPQFVAVPSTHGAAPIWAKLYRPAQLEPGKKYPIVMFVHGAGYLQNVSKRYPAYFREQMFHNLLVERGYIVLDMDYRASKGYGRDWRTAIYRQMGYPELEDYIDGVNWMAANQQGDLKNVGVYGGSYGGFMTFMALMRAPDMFKSGAALRPVSDWTTYNHDYTANILNTPDVDPEAYKKSSPIEYADQLRGNLLIAHGMVDDNVFYQDSVRIAQRLIELKKDHWELASYPLERHGFVQPESWYDEYRRIYQLFERTLKQ